MISQRRELALRIGLYVGNILCIPGDDRRWIEIMIANALTRATLWTQSGPGLKVDWEGRDQLSEREWSQVILDTYSDLAADVGMRTH